MYTEWFQKLKESSRKFLPQFADRDNTKSTITSKPWQRQKTARETHSGMSEATSQGVLHMLVDPTVIYSIIQKI
jgi:hypothetical protein